MLIDEKYKEIEAYIFEKLPMFSRIGADAFKKDLTNIKTLCDFLGNPQNTFKSIHIGGTNGKGSSTHYLASILMEYGLKVGIYSSPHLIDYRERIKIGNQWIPKEFVINFIEKTKGIIEEIHPSYFEISVAMAFDYFAHEKVDIACIEVGLGGRLDSTNIINPILSIITNISHDHNQMLGDTLEEIAFEKAGIIKKSTPVIIGEYQSDTISAVFVNKSKENISSIQFASENVQYIEEESKHVFHLKENSISLPKYIFEANYTLKNIATVLFTIEALISNKLLLHHFDNDNIEKGFINYYKNTGFAGRWMRIEKYPNVILESAHNEAGIENLKLSLSKTHYKNLYIIYGTVKDKDVQKIVSILPKNVTHYILTQTNIPRAMPVEELNALFTQFGITNTTSITNSSQAFSKALEMAEKDDLILVTGSIFLVGEILSQL
jgi:dihydrofolate synthase/folylpolyglutamate synthase